MEMIRVRSSAITAIGYDPSTRRLSIQFKGQARRYDFCGVPEHIYSGLMHASSKGRYYDQHIRNRYQC